MSNYDNAGTLSVSGRRYQASTGRLKVSIDNAAAEAVHAEVSLMKGSEAVATNRTKIAPSGDSVILTGVSSPHGRIKVEQLKTARGPQADGPIRPRGSPGSDPETDPVETQPALLDGVEDAIEASEEAGKEAAEASQEAAEGGLDRTTLVLAVALAAVAAHARGGGR
jgi:hypothetical protein